MTTSALTRTSENLPAGLQNAVQLWADHTTDATSRRRRDLLRDKTRAVSLFFQHCQKPVHQVNAIDVKLWQAHLESLGLAPSTVYARVSRVSSFYTWAMDAPELADRIRQNPVTLARPKAPQAYATDSTKSLTDDELRELLMVVRDAAQHSIHGKRDYAMLLFYVSTGMRRAEICRLRWQDIHLNGTVTIRAKVKGGTYQAREIADPRVKDALLDYLKASERLDEMTPSAPLWTAHDRTRLYTGNPLSSHSFSKNLKKWALLAGIPDIHVHQLRHSYARLVAEQTGSIIETQDALGHANIGTTRVYVQAIAVKKDKHSVNVLNALDA